MSDEVLRGDVRCPRTLRAFLAHRLGLVAAEAGYDIAAWLCSLLATAWATRDLAGTSTQPFLVVSAALAVGLVQAASGMLTGLYPRRYQRGSLDEVVAVGKAAAGTTLSLCVLSGLLMPGQRAPLATGACAVVFALPAMLGVRYIAFAVRQRSRAAASTAVKIIIFGAGSAGTQLAQRLAGQHGSDYRPVAMLDDDPALRGLRIRGIPVLGGRDQMAAMAATNGAKVLVIAIARASGAAIRELTAAAERCGLTPKVIPSINELLSGSARIDGVRDPQIGRAPWRERQEIARVALIL